MDFNTLTPELAETYNAWKDAVYKDGALTRKHKELIALGVSHAILCKYCIKHHAKAARAAGASEEEIAECIMIGAQIGAGSSLTYARHSVKHE